MREECATICLSRFLADLTLRHLDVQPATGHVSVESIELNEVDGKTTARNRVKFASIEDRDGMLRNGMEKGAAETMGRLAVLVEEMAAT